MEITTLDAISTSSMVTAFNRAFSDYAINFSYTHENFQRKIISENIIPEYSVGAFADGELIAFILHGLDEIDGQKRVFNAGTGVIPEYRGQRIVQELYNYILPVLKKKGYRHHQLEVLDGNDKAEKIYANAGFSRYRNVLSYSGVVTSGSIPGIELKEVASVNWDIAKSFCDMEPTWQNGFPAIHRTIDTHTIVTAYREGNFVGFAIYDTLSGRLRQFGVKKEERGKGIGKALFAYVCKKKGQVSFTNYDTNDTEAIAFFEALGLKRGYELIEMRLFY
jgi:ribosomal protein S18 acetylase RimI-like enzyme